MAGELRFDPATGQLVYSPATGQLALDCGAGDPCADCDGDAPLITITFSGSCSWLAFLQEYAEGDYDYWDIGHEWMQAEESSVECGLTVFHLYGGSASGQIILYYSLNGDSKWYAMFWLSGPKFGGAVEIDALGGFLDVTGMVGCVDNNIVGEFDLPGIAVDETVGCTAHVVLS